VRPATYFLARCLLNGFAHLWGRPGYGPASGDMFRLTLQTLIAMRFLSLRVGSHVNPGPFDGIPTPIGLWVYLNPRNCHVYAF
jgi:hypothetical protein